MKVERVFLAIIFIFSLALPVFAKEWLDEFDGNELDNEWFRITWRPGDNGSATVEDGTLLINEPGDFGHLITDGRPLVLRKAPKDDFSISAFFDTDPPAPAENYWIGLFIIKKDGGNDVLAENYAVLGFGGEATAKKTIIADMTDNTFVGHGQFPVPEWPIYLKLEKIGNQYTGYQKQKEAEEWKKIGNPWTQDMEEPELVGIGFLNNWGGGPDLTLRVEYFLLEGDKVIPNMAVDPAEKLCGIWGRIKLGE